MNLKYMLINRLKIGRKQQRTKFATHYIPNMSLNDGFRKCKSSPLSDTIFLGSRSHGQDRPAHPPPKIVSVPCLCFFSSFGEIIRPIFVHHNDDKLAEFKTVLVY